MKIDLLECKNLTAKKRLIRKTITEMFMDFLKEKFEENKGDVLQVGTNEIAAAVAIDNIDGFEHDVCVLVKAEVKSWTTPAEDAKRKIEPYDRFEAAKAYEKELELKKRKKDSKKSK